MLLVICLVDVVEVELDIGLDVVFGIVCVVVQFDYQMMWYFDVVFDVEDVVYFDVQ